MEEAVKLLEDAVISVNNKLNSIAWKLELYQSSVGNFIKNKPECSMVNIIELMKSFEFVEEEHTKMVTTIGNLQEELNSVRDELQSEIDLLEKAFGDLLKLYHDVKI